VCEVKEFGEGDIDRTVQRALHHQGSWAGAVDPYRRIRDRITSAERQLRGIKDKPCLVILYNPGYFVHLEDFIVQGALFGDISFVVSVDPNGKASPQGKGIRFKPSKAKLRHHQNTTLSAVAILETFRPFKYIADRALEEGKKRHESTQPERGRELTHPSGEQIHETIEWSEELRRKHPEISRRVLRLRVFHNPFARVGLPIRALHGEYDVHFGFEEQTATYGWLSGWKEPVS
jgi:hypothetical protein